MKTHFGIKLFETLIALLIFLVVLNSCMAYTKSDYLSLTSNTALCSYDCSQDYRLYKKDLTTFSNFDIIIKYDGYNMNFLDTNKEVLMTKMEQGKDIILDEFVMYIKETTTLPNASVVSEYKRTTPKDLIIKIGELKTTEYIDLRFKGSLKKGTIDIVLSYGGFSYDEYASWTYNLDTESKFNRFYQYYDNETTNLIVPVWTIDSTTYFNVTALKYNGTSGKGANMTRLSASYNSDQIARSTTFGDLNESGKNISYEFDIYIGLNLNDIIFYSGTPNKFCHLQFNAGTNYWQWNNGGTTGYFGKEKNLSKWEHIKVTAHTYTGDCQIMFNNNGSWYDFPKRSDLTQTYALAVGLMNLAGQSIILDNVLLYNGTEPPVLAPPTYLNINYMTPNNNSNVNNYNISQNDITLKYNVTTDDTLKNCSFTLDNSVVMTNVSIPSANTTTTYSYPAVDLTFGIHNWSINCYNSSNVNKEFGVSYFNFTNITIPLTITLISPTNNSVLNQSTSRYIDFIFNISGTGIDINCSLYVNGTLLNTKTSTINQNTTINNINRIATGNSTWYILCLDIKSKNNTLILYDDINFTITDYVVTTGLQNVSIYVEFSEVAYGLLNITNRTTNSSIHGYTDFTTLTLNALEVDTTYNFRLCGISDLDIDYCIDDVFKTKSYDELNYYEKVLTNQYILWIIIFAILFILYIVSEIFKMEMLGILSGIGFLIFAFTFIATNWLFIVLLSVGIVIFARSVVGWLW